MRHMTHKNEHRTTDYKEVNSKLCQISETQEKTKPLVSKTLISFVE